jgi:hypothetical protein
MPSRSRSPRAPWEVVSSRTSSFPIALVFLALIEGPVYLAAAEEPAAVPARDGPSPDAKADDAKSAPIFYLRDNSKIAGMPKLEALEVETQYGTLKIPRDQLVRIRLARRIDTALREKISQLIVDLGHDDYDKRDTATKALGEIGAPALDFLRKAAKSANEEVKNRASILIGQIDEKASSKGSEGEDSLPEISGSEDEVSTARMTVRGSIRSEEFVIESRYGDLRVRLADLTGIVFRRSAAAAARIDVPAQNQPPGNWFDTKIDVDKAERLKIEATGQVSVRNYGLIAGPDGNREWSGNSFGNFPMLSLVGKIGKRGQPFLVGNGYTGKARGSGRLYLGVVAFSPYPGGAAGSYQVKVQVSGE